ncbi:hypothetical protein Tco_1487566 [Tanacetum coccineum]
MSLVRSMVSNFWVVRSVWMKFDHALRASLEKIVTASGPGFGDWQWRLATLPIKLGGLGILSAGDISKLLVPMFFEGSLCPSCNTHRMDQWGDHTVYCSSEAGVKFWHGWDHGAKGGSNGLPLGGREGSTTCRPFAF